MKKLSILALVCVVFICCNSKVKTDVTSQEIDVASEEVSKKPDLASIETDGGFFFDYSDGRINIHYTKVETVPLENGDYALNICVQIKNNSSKKFFISDIAWKLLDADMIEIKEQGIYNTKWSHFEPGDFFFTIVEPGLGKNTEVGYQVQKGDYYLYVAGGVIAKITI